jgi:hypothetical protein
MISVGSLQKTRRKKEERRRTKEARVERRTGKRR